MDNSLASCTACSAAKAIGCTAGTCAAGFHTFAGFFGTTPATCTACTGQAGCATDTAATCSIQSSILTELKCTTADDGYYIASDEVVTACVKFTNAATVTCTSNSNSVVATCNDGSNGDVGSSACVANTYGSTCDSTEGAALCGGSTGTTVRLHIKQTTR